MGLGVMVVLVIWVNNSCFSNDLVMPSDISVIGGPCMLFLVDNCCDITIMIGLIGYY